MKRTFKLFQVFLLIYGAIGADADEVKTVSVIEGDSVTLNPDLTQTQGIILMLWRFGDIGSTIAQIDENDISYHHLTEIFGGKLQLDQTGSLTINNMRIKHSGLYQLQINTETSRMTFNVTVSEPPSLIGGGEAEIKSVSVKEGDSVTLQTDVTETHGDELIVWRFGDERKLIAKCDIETKSSTLYETDERFRGRLKLNDQTGSLTITDTRTTHSGPYRVKISSNKQTSYERFAVTVIVIEDPGLSPGAVAGIVVVVVLLVFAAAGVYYYCHKVSILKRQRVPPETVKREEGTFAVLQSFVTGIREGDQMRWFFEDGESPIATMRKKGKKTVFYDNRRFRGRLQLDPQTGSLIIRNLRKTDSGLYHLEFKSTGGTTYRKYKVTLFGEVETKSVKEGDDVTLESGDSVKSVAHFWTFEEEGFIASATMEDKKPEYSNKRFKDRLELNPQTGSLTIKNIKPEHTGLYKVKKRMPDSCFKAFNVVLDDSTETRVNTGYMGRIQWCGLARNRGLFREETDEMETVEMEEGKDLNLKTNTEIQTDDEIILRFGTSFRTRLPYVTIARFSKTGDEFKPVGRFKDRLLLDHTGSLIITIKNFTITDCGDYYVQITGKKNKSFKSFTCIVVPKGDAVNSVSEMKGKPAFLQTKFTALRKDNQILWTFGPHGMIIASSNTTFKCDKRFENRVKLEPTTGSLTIGNITDADSGLYQLQIIIGNRVRKQSFSVTVNEKDESTSLQITESDQDEGKSFRDFMDEIEEMEARPFVSSHL